ncbi:hypothetical protein PFISCL1PPCAC_4967, partial [Pristionchus fissidentatus]
SRMEFEENLEVFFFFGIIHCKLAAILVGAFGLLSIVGLAGAGVAFFEWWRHETAIDVIALIGFSIFLIGGVAAHSTLLYALQNTRVRLVVPFIVFHCFMIAVNSITALIAVGEIVSDQSSVVDDSDRVARIVLIALPLASAVEVIMLIVVFRARWYLRLRARHLRNGRPPRVNHVTRYGFSLSAVLGRTKHNEDSSATTATTPAGAHAAPASAGARVAPAPENLPLEELAPAPAVEAPRRKVIAIRVATPPELRGNAMPQGTIRPFE